MREGREGLFSETSAEWKCRLEPGGEPRVTDDLCSQTSDNQEASVLWAGLRCQGPVCTSCDHPSIHAYQHNVFMGVHCLQTLLQARRLSTNRRARSVPRGGDQGLQGREPRGPGGHGESLNTILPTLLGQRVTLKCRAYISELLKSRRARNCSPLTKEATQSSSLRSWTFAPVR